MPAERLHALGPNGADRPPDDGNAKLPGSPPDEQERVDEASAESMDASDPPAFGGVSAVGSPPPPVTVDDAARREAVRRRAYELWELAGRPHGADVWFWLQAERELGR